MRDLTVDLGQPARRQRRQGGMAGMATLAAWPVKAEPAEHGIGRQKAAQLGAEGGGSRVGQAGDGHRPVGDLAQVLGHHHRHMAVLGGPGIQLFCPGQGVLVHEQAPDKENHENTQGKHQALDNGK